jgi:(p)ppGpp synthase/HD superfamily hydrolase
LIYVAGLGRYNTTYQVELKILARDRRHLLGDISNAIAEEKYQYSVEAYSDERCRNF